MFKKILSLMLCLMLCISCLPMTAMAEEAAEPPVQDEIPVDVDDDTPAPDLEDQTSTPDTVDEAPAPDTDVETPTPEAQDSAAEDVSDALHPQGGRRGRYLCCLLSQRSGRNSPHQCPLRKRHAHHQA